MRQQTARRIAVLGALALVVSTASGCQQEASPPDGTSASSSQDGTGVEEVLDALGADRVFAMVGDHAFTSDLGVIVAGEVAPAATEPELLRLYNLHGNGREVVLVGTVDEDDTLGGPYRLVDGEPVPLPDGPVRMYAPTVTPDGTVLSIGEGPGFWRLGTEQQAWRQDRRLRRHRVGRVTASASGDLFAVTRPGTGAARLVRMTANRTTRLGPVHCALDVLPSPDASLLVAQPTMDPAVRRYPGCENTHVMDRDGRDVVALPSGWNALTWSADSSGLLVTKDEEIAVWTLAGDFEATAEVGTGLFAAAPLYIDQD